MTRALVAVLLAVVAAARLAAQADVGARLDRRVHPEVARAVQEIATSLAARGLPVEPIIQKALEGGAKGVPDERVIAAVRALAAQLEGAANALRTAGIERPNGDAIDGAAYALSTGLEAKQVAAIARASRPPLDPALTLRVAGTLAALGVPPGTTLNLVQGEIRAGRTPDDILNLPSEVQAGIARGSTPTEAAAGLARAAAARAAGGPPHDVPPGKSKSRKP